MEKAPLFSEAVFCMETTGLCALDRQHLLALSINGQTAPSLPQWYTTWAKMLVWVQTSALESQNQSREDPGMKPGTVTTPGCAWKEREKDGDFPGGLVTKTLHSQCREPRLDPWSGD